MSRDYGQMVSYEQAIAWIEENVSDNAPEKDRVLARMNYEHDKSVPLKPVYHRGLYGSKYDSYTCRNCGDVLSIGDNYCPNCGTKVKWDSTRCLTGHKKGECFNE